MRRVLVGLLMSGCLVAWSGCGDSSPPAAGGPGAPQPPGAPEEGPEMLKMPKTKAAKH